MRKQRVQHFDPSLDQPGIDITAIDGLDDSGGARDLPHPIADGLELLEGAFQALDGFELVDGDGRYAQPIGDPGTTAYFRGRHAGDPLAQGLPATLPQQARRVLEQQARSGVPVFGVAIQRQRLLVPSIASSSCAVSSSRRRNPAREYSSCALATRKSRNSAWYS